MVSYGSSKSFPRSENPFFTLENICGAGQTIEDKLNIDAGKLVLAMFLN